MPTDPSPLLQSVKAVQILADAHLDIVCHLEQTGEPPPAYFRTRRLLEEWAARPDLPPARGNKHALVLRGWKRTEDVRFGFTQVWVRSRYTRYRNRMKSLYAEAFQASRSDFDDIHADHVINRGSVSDDAWVQLFPVPARVNRAFGPRVEKFLPSVDPRVDSMVLPPLIFFKLFCRAVPQSEQGWNEAIRHVRDQILRVRPGS